MSTPNAQREIFHRYPDRPPRRKRHRVAETSRDGLQRTNTPNQQSVVLQLLRSCGPMTRHEIAAAAQLPLSSVCGRVAELIKAGSISIAVNETGRVRRDGRYVLTATLPMRRTG